eukprot:Nitzschia sp. Nitz4//scaffold46_size129759//41315//41479//NITZ4_003494-RA/size129759-est2genome-gene-0.157-mRNA-1//1//CDS//3329552574//734//frame0
MCTRRQCHTLVVCPQVFPLGRFFYHYSGEHGSHLPCCSRPRTIDWQVFYERRLRN